MTSLNGGSDLDREIKRYRGACQRRSDRWTKRAVDLFLAGLLLVVCVPLLFVVVVGLQINDPGPIFFRQTRVGLLGRTFQLWKLRTMYTDSERRLRDHFSRIPEARLLYERTSAVVDDPRSIRPLGEWCRRFSVDELPQLLNVIRGDMSLVGPRPLEPWLANTLMSSSERRCRASVMPGITGLFQITRKGKLAVGKTMIVADLKYVRGRSLQLDFRILLQTPAAVMGGRGVA